MRAGHAEKIAVVQHDNNAVLCKARVQLRAVPGLRRRAERRERVFGDAGGSVVQTAVGDVLPQKREALPGAGTARRDQEQISGSGGADGGRGDCAGSFAWFHWYHLVVRIVTQEKPVVKRALFLYD